MGGAAVRQVREEMRRVLACVDERWVEAASRDLCERLIQFLAAPERQYIRHILGWTSYMPGEPDLAYVLGQQMGQRSIYLPRELSGAPLVYLKIDHDPLSADEPQVTEASGAKYDTDDAAETLLLVPGVAFDRFGNRLGLARDPYRAFLTGKVSAALKVGVCWELQLVPEVPPQSDELLVEWICTEQSMIGTEVRFEDEL